MDHAAPGPGTLRTTALTGLGLGLLVLAVFGGSLDNGFVYDDPQIVSAETVVGTLDPSQHLASAFWAGSTSRFPYYRPASTWSLALDRAAQGEGPGGYHRTNLLLHAWNAFLVYLLVRRFAAQPIAAAAGVLFAVHPVQTEAVAWIVARADLLATTGVLLGALLYARLPDRPGLRDLPTGLLACGALSVALLSKESAVTFPAVLLGVDLARQRSSGAAWGPTLKAVARRWMRFAPVGAALVGGYLALRHGVTGAWLGAPAGADAMTEPLWKNPLLDAAVGTRWMTAATIAARYLRLIAWPLRLSVDYFHDVVPMVESPANVAFLVSLPIVAGAAVLGVLAARRWPAAAFGAVTAAGTWALVSQLPFAAPIVMAERALYLPMVGVAASIAAAAIALKGRLPIPAWRTLAVLAVLLLGWRSFQRVQDWHDNRSLFESAVATTPRSATAWNNLGAAQRIDGDVEAAVASFGQAAAIAPNYLRARLNEARAHLELDRTDDAERLFRRAVDDFPRQQELIWLELVQVHERQAQQLLASGNAAAARQAYADVIEEAGLLAETSEDPQAQAGLLLIAARAAATAGRADIAENAFSKAIQATLKDDELTGLRVIVLEELARFLARTRRPSEAAETYDLAARTALEIDDRSGAARLLGHAARVYDAAGDVAAAAASRDRAAAIAPGSAPR